MNGRRFEKPEKWNVLSFPDIKLRNLWCVNCQHQFFVKDPVNLKRETYVPLLLPCGHQVCYQCSNKHPSLTCKVCSMPESKSDPAKKLDLPVNIYMLGVITSNQNRPVCLDNPDLGFYQSTNARIRQSFSQGHCNECMKKASVKCVECNVLLCAPCHSKLHGKALENHHKIVISNSKSSTDLSLYTKCPEHTDEILNFYCPGCDTVICSKCMIDSHNEHPKDLLSDKNNGLKEEFQRTYDKVAETLGRVHQSQKKLQSKSVSTQQWQNTELIEETINQHFAQMHGVLQNLEKDLIEQIIKQQQCFGQNLESLKLKLESQEEILQNGLSLAASVKDSLGNINLISVIEDLESITNVPCHLVEGPTQRDKKIRFDADKSVIDVLKTHCTLTLPDLTCYTLSETKNLPADYVLEQTAPLPIPSLWNNAVEESPSSPALSTVSSLPSLHPLHGDPFNLAKETSVYVEISHIISPASFYVHQQALVRDLNEFNEALTDHALKAKEPSEIIRDTLYIAKYQNSWCRGRAKRVFKDGNGQIFCEVFYIDYGNLGTVSISDMRNLSPQFSTQSPFAIKCRLSEVEPKEGEWNDDAIKLTNNLLFKKKPNEFSLIMYINDIIDNVYIVDIGKSTTGKLISLRESLIMSGYAAMTSTVNLMKTNPSAVRKFFHQELKPETYTPVLCIEIESPDNIFIVKATKQSAEYEKMQTDMRLEYRKGKSKKWLIKSPEVGMLCAVLHSDSFWYRAIICDIPCIQTVELFYVDEGIKSMQSFNKIRKLQHKFLVYETRAIHISLKDVAPIPSNGSKWSPKAIKYLKSLLKEVKVKVFPFSENQMNPFYKSYSACLYTSDNVNINALLVSSNYAISTGVSSQDASMKKEKKAENLIKSKKTLNGLASNCGGSTLSISSKSERNIDDMDPFKFRITISNAISPDCIYVADPTRVDSYQILHEKMQEFYNKHVSISELELQKDQTYAVYSKKDKAFYRARLLDIKSESEYFVLFIDLGIEEIVSFEDLQPLNRQFSSEPRLQFKVKLADITAPGGSSSWPSSSNQKLRDIIYENESCKFFISKVGEPIDDVIPVELWVKLFITAGPLDPTKIVMKSVSRLLVENGFAIPIKGYSHDAKRSLAVEFKKQLTVGEHVGVSEISWSTKKEEDDTLVNCHVSLKSCDNESELSFNSDSESDGYVSSDSIPMPAEKCKWIPAKPIKQESFIAVPTYVDNDCCVYLHPKNGYTETLKLIESQLDKRYCRRTIKPYDKFWEVGDICVAQYHFDKKWYRAEVKKIVDEKTVQVEFVDYGNVEECEIGTLKKRVILQDVPIQCTKCVIFGLYPNTAQEVWPTSILDKIHNLLVDKECEVNVLNISETSPRILPIRITLTEINCDLIKYLIQNGLNIQNPNESCVGSESTANSLVYENMQRSDCNSDCLENNGRMKGFLQDCENYVGENSKSETDFLEQEISTSEEVKEPEGLKTKNEKGVASSLESLSWNDIINKDARLTTSTPQVDANSLKSHEKINAQGASSQGNISSVEDSSESNSPSPYLDIMDFLNNGDLIRMDVSSITEKCFKTNALEFRAHVTGGNKEIQSFAEEYKKMDESIQNTAQLQPIIENPEINMPCYALYTDGKWYRGLITQGPTMDSLEVKVKYVDFGNSISVDITKLRKMHNKWLNLPRMFVNCRSYDFVPSTKLSRTSFALKVIEFFENEPLFAKLTIANRKDRTLTVDLFFDEECSKSALLPLVKKGLLEPTNQEDCL